MSDYFDRVEGQIGRRVQGGVPRAWRLLPITLGHVATAAAVLVVLVVAGVFLLARGHSGENAAPGAGADVRVVLTAATGAAPGSIERSAQILRARLRTVVPGATVSA